MSKTIRIKVPKAKHRNEVARQMIEGGQRSQIFTDRRDKRNKNPKNQSWDYED